MALDLNKNARTAAVKCAPCCHVYKPIYYGVVAVITPSYGNGITHSWINVGYNVGVFDRIFTVFGYSLTSFGIGNVSVSDDGKTRIYLSTLVFDVPTDDPNYTGGTNTSRSNSNSIACVIYLKLLIKENALFDAYISYDSVNWEKQSEQFLGDYLTFVADGNVKIYGSDPASYKAAKIRITINTGEDYYTPNERFFLYNGAGCYDKVYKYLVSGTLQDFLQNLCCTENKYKLQNLNIEVYGKIGGAYSLQTFGAENVSGPSAGAPIISPSFSWVPNSSMYNEYFYVKDDGTVVQQTSAIVDFREPVTYVSKPYYYKAQVNFWDITRQFNTGGHEFITNAELTITE